MVRPVDVAERATKRIEAWGWLDRPSYRLEHALAMTLNLFGDATETVRGALHGVWLGHPVHPPMTDVPVGAWTAAEFFDVVALTHPTRRAAARGAARACIGIGLAGAGASAVTGLADWQYTHDNARRVGLVHGVLNAVAIGLYSASWLTRRHGRPWRGMACSGAGYLVAATSAYLGGTLVSRHRIGVDHSDRRLEPRGFTPVLAEQDLGEDEPRPVSVQGSEVMMVRHNGTIYALTEHCAHLGGPLSEGWIYRDSIVCPWHGSQFDLASGKVMAGPATAHIDCLQNRVRDGQIEVRRRPPVPETPPGSVVAREQRTADAGN